MPKIFAAGQRLRVYFDYQSVEESSAAHAFRQAFNNSLEQLRRLQIFSAVISVGSSEDCDIFVTFAAIQANFGAGDLIGDTLFRVHANGKRYAQIKLDARASWSFAPAKWFWKFFDKSQRVERWLNHELLHAIGCSHTTEKVSPMPSILDEDNSMDQRIDIPDWDKAYARSLYGLADPHSNQL